jgi:hypothetical protein
MAKNKTPKTPSASAVDRAAPLLGFVWSAKPPRKAGHYWCRARGIKAFIAKLKHGGTQLHYGERILCSKLPDWQWEWAGPIPEPNVKTVATEGAGDSPTEAAQHSSQK